MPPLVRHAAIIILLAALFAAQVCANDITITAKDLQAGHRLAKKMKKPLLVIAGANWCPDCRRMDKTILPVQEVQEFITTNYVFVHLDSDSKSGKALMRKYKAKAIPHLFVFDSHGKIRGEAAAEHVDPSSFVELVKSLTDKNKQP